MNKIAQIVVDLPMAGPFDYLVPAGLRKKIVPGQRVDVPFSNSRMVGCVVGLKNKSSFHRLKSIFNLLDNGPLMDAEALALAENFAQYYGCSLGQAVATFFPTALRKKRVSNLTYPGDVKISSGHAAENLFCLDPGLEERAKLVVSKITEILDRGQGVIVLVPEIHMIGQLCDLLRRHFAGPVCVLDKNLSEKQELEQWTMIREGKAGIVIGTRSAVFAPMRSLGLIIVFDEENPSFKQEQVPCYHVREVMRMRQELCACSILDISSAPSAEFWWRVKTHKVRQICFSPPPMSPLQVIDMTNYKRTRKFSMSFPLQQALTDALAGQARSVLILNRRGFSTMTLCNNCGFVMTCDRCGVNLTFLYSRKKLVCRLCQAQKDLPGICPSCSRSYLRSQGAGIEKIESELCRIFPQARIGRFDRETQDMPSNANIIVATQAVMRVLEPGSVHVIGLLDFDAELNRADFRSAQKAFSRLITLRQTAKEKVLVQTQVPYNYCLEAAGKADFGKFYDQELGLRRELELPPFRHLVSVGIRGPKEEDVFERAQELHQNLIQAKIRGLDVLDPQPDTPAKLRGKYRFALILKGKTVKKILSVLQPVLAASRRKGGVVVTVDVDP